MFKFNSDEFIKEMESLEAAAKDAEEFLKLIGGAENA